MNHADRNRKNDNEPEDDIELLTGQKTSEFPYLAFYLSIALFFYALYSLTIADWEIDKTLQWNRADAQITDLATHTSAFGYQLDLVKFEYFYQGKTYTSDEEGWCTQKDKKVLCELTDEELEKLLAGSCARYRCFVNPEDPEEALLFCNPDKKSGWLEWAMLVAGAIAVPYFGIGARRQFKSDMND